MAFESGGPKQIAGRAQNLPQARPQLLRALTLTDATSIVIGTTIGAGVFLKTAVMAQLLGTPALVLGAWLAAGLLALAGALTYAELGALLPQAGGEYVYLRVAYGDLPAFLFGWMRSVVGGAGIGALGVGSATFLFILLPVGKIWVVHTFHLFGQNIHWQFGAQQVAAVAIILIFSATNCLGIAFGGRVQSVFTSLKVLSLLLIVAGVFFFSRGGDWSNLTLAFSPSQLPGLKAFGAAMVAALWAYNGWSFLPMVAGEVQSPGRNIPRALITGMLVVLVVYGLANLAYFYVLPMNEIATSNSSRYPNALPVAAKAAQSFLGPVGIAFVSISFLVSTLGALNGVILSVARVPFAMARDGLFFSKLGDLSQNSHVPLWAIGAQAMWASLLAISGTFDQLTNLAIFSYWIFYGATTASVFVLRHKMATAARPYRTLGYPIVPLVFVLVAGWLTLNTLWVSPVESVGGAGLITLGLPVYYYYCRYKRQLNMGHAE